MVESGEARPGAWRLGVLALALAAPALACADGAEGGGAEGGGAEGGGAEGGGAGAAGADDSAPLEGAADPARGGRGDSRTPRGPEPSGDGYLGVVVAREAIDVSAPLDGEIDEIPVRIGDTVEAGDTLAVMDHTRIREALAATRAELSGARADLRRARADVEQARDRLERRRELRDTVSEEELERARYEARRASAARDRAGAEVRGREARVAELQRELADATVKAPVAGRVSLRYRDPGSRVSTGAPIARLLAGGRRWIRFAVPPADGPALEVGDELEAEIESVDGGATATIRQIAPEVDPHSQMVLVEASLEAPEGGGAEIQSGLAVRLYP